MRHSALPGPLVRLARNRIAALGLLTIAALAAATAGITQAVQVRVTGEVDANWRGAYDILVRPRGARIAIESTAGVVEPNFISFSGTGGISSADLARVRRVAGVELAAPIGYVGYLEVLGVAPAINLGPAVPGPALYRLTISASSSDGLEDVLVQRQAGRVLVTGDAAPVSEFPGMGDCGEPSPDCTYSLDGEVIPAIASPVIAVDPTAELQLVGEGAAALRALAAFPPADARTVGDIADDAIPDEFPEERLQLHFAQESPDKPVIPVLVSRSLYASLAVDLAVERVGAPLDSVPPAEESLDSIERRTGGGLTPVGSSRLDATDRLYPFALPFLDVDWPGSLPQQQGEETTAKISTDLVTRLPSRPEYSSVGPRPGSDRLSFAIHPAGIVDAGGRRPGFAGRLPGGLEVTPGLERAYRGFREVELDLVRDFVPAFAGDRPFLFAPVGTFDLAAFQLPQNPLSYVPLGAYVPPDTVLVAGPDGRAVERTPMRPTLNPAGLIAVPPLAITDLAGAEVLRGPSPIDAIRVRVAGVTDFSPQSRARVEQVASAIAALGLDVDIVAGSSPQPVEVYVPGYHVAQDETSTDLGWVSQGWTTLGAAERVERGLTRTSEAMLLVALGAAAFFVVGLQALGLATRTAEVAILRAVGWTRLRILRWTLAEALVAAAGVAVLAVAMFWIGGRSGEALRTGLLMALLLPLGQAAGTAFALRRARASRPLAGDISLPALLARLPVRSPAGYGLRTVLAHPVRMTILVAGLTIGAAGLGVGAILVAGLAGVLGPTFLADALNATARPYQLAILAILGIGGTAFALVGTAVDAAARREEWHILAASGWMPAARRRAVRVTRAIIAGLAGLVAFFLAGIVGTMVGLDAVPAGLVAAGIAALMGLALLSWRLPSGMGRVA